MRRTMPTRYLVRLYSLVDRSLVAVFDDFNSLTVEKRLNGISTHTLSMDSRDPRVALFELDALVQVQRNVPEAGIDWATEYIGFHRTPQYQLTEGGRHLFTSYGRSLEDLLNRRALLYFAPYLKSGPADDVMKSYVNENLGPLAVTPNRLRNGVVAGFAVAANESLGPTWEGSRAYRNLLEIVKDISSASHVDFSIEPTALGTEFRTYFPQRGVDRSVTANPAGSGRPSLIFSPEFGNMANVNYIKSRTEEATTVLVTGAGVMAARNYYIESSAALADSPINDIEITHDARNETVFGGLVYVAHQELEQNAAQESISFDAVQTPAAVYGRDYFMGDIVTVRFADANVQFDKKILGLNINVADGKETIRFAFGDTEPVPLTDPEALRLTIQRIIERLRAIEYGTSIQ